MGQFLGRLSGRGGYRDGGSVASDEGAPMKKITETYSEIIIQARKFAMEHESANSVGPKFFSVRTRLALLYAKSRLELLLAAYRVEIRRCCEDCRYYENRGK